MLSTTGLIKKNLEINKKLPLKWQGFKGTLYKNKSTVEITYPKHTMTFTPHGADLTSYYNSKFTIITKVNLAEATYNSSDLVIMGIGISSKKTGEWTAFQAQYYQNETNRKFNFTSTAQSSGQKLISIPSSWASCYLKLEYESGSAKAYYSINGSSWTYVSVLKTIPLSDWDDIYIRQTQKEPLYLKMEDFQFYVNDELKFGKIE